VPADPASLRLFVDESLLGLGKVLAIARSDVVHPGHPRLPEVPLGAEDMQWIEAVAARGLAVLTRDKRIRRKRVELKLLQEHAMRVFWITVRRDLTTWGYLELVVRHWDGIETALAKQSGPWFLSLTRTGLRKI
jgi:hypothetical protein